ncbi:Pyruvate-formate lyase-activating enzyme [Halapricum desulfuricans]|uniref:Pyruvate-formate lyase-activating enzyme n=1 Tax=Halapricum desulfuricans TaxID=2841257 RepID=A0A897NKR1_9EURY|nr:AmmeMemoRadiSam system radical SAM enzyme [Halapricum desulfuricans]QSG12025.1 Pyruvate-formate lyase-activating enzyme [Halapricum desulfuricans]
MTGEPLPPRETEHYETVEADTVRCLICPRTCEIPAGERGVCGVRENRDGRLYLTTYGRAVSTSIDPIEKKPLFHVAPGADVLSVATEGCNLRCDFCQNYRIAIEYEGVTEHERPPEELAGRIEAGDADGMAYTYTEPTIFMEYALDTMRASPDDALQVFVSNGYMRPETVDTLAPHLDAINIDIKGDREFYRKHTGIPDPEPIFETVERFAERDVHLEVTNLVIPGENDDEASLRDRMEWIADAVGTETPVHVSRFHPDYKLTDVPPTPIETIELATEIAGEAGLEYVYSGNVPGHESESTYCPDCGRLLIEREGFAVRGIDLEDGACPNCGREIPIHGTPRGPSSGRRRML